MCKHSSYCPHQMFGIYLLFPGTTGFFLHLLSNKSTSQFSWHVSYGLCTSVFRGDPYSVSVGCQRRAREAEIGEEPRICLQMVEVGNNFKNPGQSSQRGVKREGHGRGCLSHGKPFLRKQMECVLMECAVASCLRDALTFVEGRYTPSTCLGGGGRVYKV